MHRPSKTDIQATLWGMIYCEIIGILIIVIAFISPLPKWAAILIAGGVTLMAFHREMSVNSVSNQAKKTYSDNWFTELTLRNGLDDFISKSQSGSSYKIDWKKATEEAARDIEQYHQAEKFREELGSSSIISFVIYVVWGVILIPLRGLVGYGIAWVMWNWYPMSAYYMLTIIS